jgi:nicotinamide-nucleotide amidase
MSREITVSRKIALLATGDEIIQGDILNSNSQEIALRLVEQGLPVRMHASTADSIDDIVDTLRFLLAAHDAVIITGGLGPTSDDLTRFAVSQVIDRPLVFDEAIWQNICERLQKFGYPVPPESNRQQALFPTDSTIIPNPNGTAAGCYASFGDKLIFMLPGPPAECLPMMQTAVIPTLIAAQFQQIIFRKKWLLFGVSEGKIAEEFDTLAKPFQCVTGYRLWHPYLEFKVHSSNEPDFLALTALIDIAAQPYMLGTGKQAASVTLRENLAHSPQVLYITDNVTGGLLETTLKTPKTFNHLHFHAPDEASHHIEIHGLREYWEGRSDVTRTEITYTFTVNQKTHEKRIELPFRGKRVLQYAVEFICDEIDKILFRSAAD